MRPLGKCSFESHRPAEQKNNKKQRGQKAHSIKNASFCGKKNSPQNTNPHTLKFVISSFFLLYVTICHPFSEQKSGEAIGNVRR